MMYSLIEIFNQTLGYGGTVVSCFIKVPVILNILRRKNYDGLSAMCMILETSAYIATMWYNVYRRNALYTYGDLVATVIQNSIIVLLMLYFGPKGQGFSSLFHVKFFISVLLYFSVLWYLLSINQLHYLVLYGAIVPILSRLSQVYKNLSQSGVVGVQSSWTALNSFLRPCIKLYYSSMVTKDAWLQSSSLMNMLVNLILLVQVSYWLPQRQKQH